MNNKKIEIKNLKGTADFLPPEQALRQKIMDTLKQTFSRFGYLPLETPILNEFDLLKYKYQDGAEILKEIYTLHDQGNRDIGLRYDLTIPFCKVIALNKNLLMPFRRYEIGKVFRDGPVKAGRTREFYQCDADIVGVDGRFVELEQMQMAINVFKQLGIDIIVKWNNRKLMTGIIQEVGISDDKIDSTIGLIDRLEKISKEELIKEFDKIGIDEKIVEKLMQNFANNLQDYEKVYSKSTNENIVEGLKECLELQNLIEALELENNTQFCPTLARGLGIYTGTVFEFFDKEKHLTSSLGGGGRYNKIITGFMDNGVEYPAVGLSFGLEPIYAILSQTFEQTFVDVLIAPMDTEIECLRLANKLRENDIKTIVSFGNKKLKKVFDYANKTNVRFVIVIGEDEIKNNLFTIKNMQTSEQTTTTFENILKIVKNN